jgi:acylphosphatase
LPKPVRAQVFYSGRVQGVGFRWRAAMSADGLPVAGFVRNLADGRVEIVAEGRRRDVEKLLAAVRRRMGDKVEDEAVEWLRATGEFNGFGVRR